MSHVMPSGVVIACAAMLGLGSLASAGGTDTYEEVIFDLTGVTYMGGAPVITAELEIGPAQVAELRWDNVVLQTFDNTGIPNWGSEAYFGFQAVTEAAEPEIIMVQPFPNGNSGGIHGPVSGSLDVELDNLFGNSEGLVYLMTASSWPDGSGLPAGEYTQGTLSIVYIPVPAPGAIAVLGLAAFFSRRRRQA
ncbi:MAG: hypothetical protein QF723_05345 [Phycisphaerales bacterium]|jgi:MYXO-CTERM domain-containing protein|nr:hypothetical protein [Phycisphaerales bacterium]MDP6312240.1 hypothetical protein [Phycisphaerales bacterium]MDP7087574.1 hypothetical protein [Phycisphaerales bacterium]MDP7188967.1 hypothetical protein [Phycisphaerales bacterium]MDP7519337.1 hypothetical protein [Phycisphaerales bacterium]|tara:strand:+ start:1470 stop:2045 length:576 start_codon:yes stop_codon:yes gene_type:complete